MWNNNLMFLSLSPTPFLSPKKKHQKHFKRGAAWLTPPSTDAWKYCTMAAFQGLFSSSLQREKQKGKDGFGDWILTWFYWHLQLFLDRRSHWRETMCSGPEGNGLAPVCPQSSGEEFSHCCRDCAPHHREWEWGEARESHLRKERRRQRQKITDLSLGTTHSVGSGLEVWRLNGSPFISKSLRTG